MPRKSKAGPRIAAQIREQLEVSLDILSRSVLDAEERRQKLAREVTPSIGRPVVQDGDTFEPCQPLRNLAGPQQQFLYRLPFELADVFDLPLVDQSLELACVTILSGRVSLAADLRYSQTWDFRGIAASDISSSIALAPGEKLTLTVRKTQRTQLTQSTMDSTDSLQSTESTVVDKDVLNVVRSMTQTQQWRVDGHADLSLQGGVAFQVGASGGLSGSVTSSSNSTVEHISEVTQKSVRRLQTLQKIEVARQSETTLEDAQIRTIVNPYRDRALTLNVYELVKGYLVTTQLAEIRPSLVLEITDLELDRNFVVSQGEFLDNTLLDRTLAAELRDALQASRSPISTTSTDLSRQYARLAFHYLFEEPNIYYVDGPGAHANDPWYSFHDYDALQDTLDNDIGRVYMALGTYIRAQAAIYSAPPFNLGSLEPMPPNWLGPTDQGHPLEVAMAVALADSIKAEWVGLPPDKARNVMDHGQATEIMRRISGFLSIVDNLLRPLLKPTQDEAAAADLVRRAENVIERVIEHLHCNRAFYVQQFLDYLWRQTRGYAFSDALARVLQANQMPNIPHLLELFNPRAGFIDGFQYVVPLFQGIDLDAAIKWINQVVPAPVGTIGEFITDTRNLIVPCDGFHIEPVAGLCILQDVPDPQESVTADINVNATSA